MKIAIPRSSSKLGRLAALAMSVGILTGGLPVLDYVQEAEAATKRCMDEYPGVPKRAPRIQGNLPGYKAPGPYQWRTKGDTKRTYTYDNPRKALSDLKLPSQQVLDDLKAHPEKHPNIKINATPEHAWAKWLENQGSDNPFPGGFNRYVNTLYVNGEANQARGYAYERENAEYFKLGGRGWYCQYSLKEQMPETYKQIRQELIKDLGKTEAEKVLKEDRRFDAIKPKGRDRIIYEFKSGRDVSRAQILIDQKLAAKGFKVVYVFGAPPTPGTQKALKNAGLNWYQHRATEKGAFTPGPHTRQDPAFSTGCAPTTSGTTTMNLAAAAGRGRCSSGPANDQARNSGKNKAEARRIADAYRRAPGAINRVRGPGGIDFSSMQLRYVTEPVKGKGMDYGFKAKLNPDEDTNPSYGGGAKLDLSSDAMFTWLALDPRRFWVNLNPDQPDQVVDDKLAETDAGRVLLTADLQMKHDLAKVMVPENPTGKRLWDSFQHANGAPCWKTYRYFIEPAPAKVREENGRLYILDAPMDVKAAKIDFKEGYKCKQPEAVQEYNFRQIQRIAIPELEKIVNSSPAYADLRSVYTSRIAAEWIKQRDAVKPGDFHQIIGSDSAAKWPSRVKWSREKVYADYLKSFRNGDFHFKRKYPQDGSVLEFSFYLGGVDFSKQPKRNISRARFQAENPEMPDTVQAAQNSTVQYGDTDTGYLGGNTTGKGAGGGQNPTPTPKPTDKPTPPHDPSTPPATHTPEPGTSTPAGGGGASHPPTNDDQGGDLAHTGSDTPIGLITGVAAALATAGVALVWWMRRRKTAAE
ncbi:hypothetical protein [Streptomyces sp. NRRL S-1813]|uniref:hypothetical protein n=1 Tax=Streptomyces sp. NRRL S-1813 TaxID=1463888 RepID=UPI00131DDF54|nr:hypothetical protein [Streptomyces sp. NRRL S-1813]